MFALRVSKTSSYEAKACSDFFFGSTLVAELIIFTSNIRPTTTAVRLAIERVYGLADFVTGYNLVTSGERDQIYTTVVLTNAIYHFHIFEFRL